ncbi:MAG: restriction endonuclease subunit S [Deltaproteobacteria bacterium]|nr:restriction endonuclease subunit S [Deltaproteobacteria bacterium]
MLPARGLPHVSTWERRRIGEFVELHYGKALTATTRNPGTVPVFGSNGQCGWHDSALGDGPTVVLGRKGQGPLGVEWCESPFWVIDTAYYVRPTSSEISLRFFYYLTKYVGLNHLKDGTSNPSLGRDVFCRQGFPIPPREVQDRIAAVLSTYDALLENYERRIQLLDEMVRALFHEWFVDFRYPGHDRMQLVDSAIGRIPHGWRAATVDDVAFELRRGVPKGAIEHGLPCVGLEHIPRRSLALREWDELEELGSNKLRFEAGEILFGKIRPYFHKVAVAPKAGVCSADTIVINSRETLAYGFVVALVSSDDFVAHASATANGAKMPRCSWEVMGEYELAVPPDPLLKSFDAKVRVWLAEQQNLVMRIRTLRVAQALLLPRLLSGQLAVDEEEAA